MSKAVLYRKYRPAFFSDVVGQTIPVRIIQNSFRMRRVPASWIFSGVYGTGKTTVARILAKCLTCTEFDRQTAEPCGKCTSCKAVDKGRHPDVLEIDAASHGRIDDIRRLADNAQHRPTVASRKVYILDEVHQVSRDGFDALLKLLEEPPGHAVFILATTECDKLPKTILSRCTRLEFRRISLADIQASLHDLSEAESIDIDDEAIAELAAASNGSLRDAHSLLDQSRRLRRSKRITASSVRSMLGLASPAVVSQLVESLADRDTVAILEVLEDAYAKGLDAVSLANSVLQALRNLLLIKVGVREASRAWQEQAAKFSNTRLRLAVELLAFDWGAARNDAVQAQVMLEVKLLAAARQQ